jgi:hypothetical protein
MEIKFEFLLPKKPHQALHLRWVFWQHEILLNVTVFLKR